MDESGSVTAARLACITCGKISTNDGAYKRHAKYCLQAQRRPRKRMRSCFACAVAKQKCSFGQPCTRCALKNIMCKYEQRALSIAAPAPAIKTLVNDEDISHSGHVDHCHTPPWFHRPATDQCSSWAQMDFLPDIEVVDLTRAAFQETSCDQLKDFYAELSGGQSMSSTALVIMGTLSPNPSSAAVSIIEGFDSNTIPTSPRNLVSMENNYAGAPCAPQLSSDKLHLLRLRADLHTLARNQIPRHGYRLAPSLRQYLGLRPLDMVRNEAIYSCTRMAILDGLRSYPVMMTRRKTFPPIIHRYYDPATNLPTALFACSDIARMFVSAPHGQRKDVWLRVSAQHALFRANIDVASKVEILSQIQADLIFVLMRALDEPSPRLVVDLDDLQVHQVSLAGRYHSSRYFQRGASKTDDLRSDVMCQID